MTESTIQALAILRDPAQFKWYVVPWLVLVLYLYNVEAGRKDWSVFFGGLALWGVDWFNEIWNSLVLHFSGYAPVWAAPADTAFLILVGLNIEISFMFLIMGLATIKLLPEDRTLKILGIPNRWFFAILFSILSVIVEIFLNAAGALVWDWSWWNRGAPWLIFLLGYLPFFLMAFYVHDLPTVKRKIQVVGGIYAFDIVCLIVFGLLGWI